MTTDGLAVVVVTYNSAAVIRAALASCREHAPEATVYVVDNASSDGTVEVVVATYPAVVLLQQSHNRGFAGGCNAGIEAALRNGARHVMLLNPDAELRPLALQRLAAFLDSSPAAAAAQAAVLLPDGRVNSLGNGFHYLGFSAAGGNGRQVAEAYATLPWLRGRAEGAAVEVPACSGAAVLLRGDALRAVGAVQEWLFLYHEDLELSLRLRLAGWTLWMVPSAVVVHHYAFSRNPDKWFYLERNRIAVLLELWRKRTLAVLALPLLAAETAVWLQAARQGWLREKARAYGWWFRPGELGGLRRRRAALHHLRRVDDRTLLAWADARFDDPHIRSPFYDRVVNPTSSTLWRLLRPLIRW